MKNENGFTISEVLVALLLFSLVAVPLTATFNRLASDTAVKDKYNAIQLAANEMERAFAFRRIDTDKEKIINGFKVICKAEGDTLKKVTVEVYRRDKKLYSLASYLYKE